MLVGALVKQVERSGKRSELHEASEGSLAVFGGETEAQRGRSHSKVVGSCFC